MTGRDRDGYEADEEETHPGEIPFDPIDDAPDASQFRSKEFSLSLEQERAIDLLCDLSQLIVGISGGAGTGKTTVLGHGARELKRRKISYALCAPTGRAAKRVQELTKIQAKTVHRLLEYPMPDEDLDGNEVPGQPRRNRDNPFEHRVTIVDESSMLSPEIYGQLLDALPRNGVIRFIGDNNQLPPVESGKPPFIDVLDRYESIILSFNYRSDDEIVHNAGRILRGFLPEKNPRFEIIYSGSPVETLLDFVKKHKVFAQDSHQIITPTKRGKYGTDRINPSLQLKFNPKGPTLELARYVDSFKEDAKIPPPLTVRAGDKFLWIKNDYKLNMFNGEIGRIESLDTEQGSLVLRTVDRSVLVEPRVKTYSAWHGSVIDYDPRKQIELGYAITTHKSQGSEFDTVIYCMCGSQSFLLNRRNFYTAITRAKRQVILITDRAAMGRSMRRYEPK